MAEKNIRVVIVRVDSGKTSVTGLESSLVEGIGKIPIRRMAENLFSTFSERVVFNGEEYERIPGSHVSSEVGGRVVTEAGYTLKGK